MCAMNSAEQSDYVDQDKLNAHCIRQAVAGDPESLSTVMDAAASVPMEQDWQSALFRILDEDDLDDEELRLNAAEKRKAAELFGDYGLYILADCDDIIQRYSPEWEALYTKAADSIVRAQLILGLYYWKKAEFAKAWPLLGKAVAAKCSEAVAAIAWSYLEGYGKEPSVTQAMEWFLRLDLDNDSESIWYALDDDFIPVDYQTGNWVNGELLVEILEKAGREQEESILKLAPGWEKIIAHPKPLPRWVVAEEVEYVGQPSPKFLGGLRAYLSADAA